MDISEIKTGKPIDFTLKWLKHDGSNDQRFKDQWQNDFDVLPVTGMNNTPRGDRAFLLKDGVPVQQLSEGMIMGEILNPSDNTRITLTILDQPFIDNWISENK